MAGNAHFQKKNILEFVDKVERIDEVILSVSFKLKPQDKKKLWQAAKEAWQYRQTTQPLDFPSAGCIFQNPAFRSAGYLIDQCGLKGKKAGGAIISKKHANFIVNTGKASCQDVLELISLCQRKVKEKFGINLELEIIKIGEF